MLLTSLATSPAQTEPSPALCTDGLQTSIDPTAAARDTAEKKHDVQNRSPVLRAVGQTDHASILQVFMRTLILEELLSNMPLMHSSCMVDSSPSLRPCCQGVLAAITLSSILSYQRSQTTHYRQPLLTLRDLGLQSLINITCSPKRLETWTTAHHVPPFLRCPSLITRLASRYDTLLWYLLHSAIRSEHTQLPI